MKDLGNVFPRTAQREGTVVRYLGVRPLLPPVLRSPGITIATLQGCYKEKPDHG